MHPQNLCLTPKQYSILGRLCALQQPEVAKQLLSIYDEKPTATDHSQIGAYFQQYCKIHSINPDDYRGSLFKSHKIDQRRLFIACMVRLYLPHLYVAPAGFRLEYGFTGAIASTFKQKGQNIAKMVREVIVHERAYPEFKAAVDEITSKLISS